MKFVSHETLRKIGFKKLICKEVKFMKIFIKSDFENWQINY